MLNLARPTTLAYLLPMHLHHSENAATVNSLITHTPSGEALRYGLLGSMGY